MKVKTFILTFLLLLIFNQLSAQISADNQGSFYKDKVFKAPDSVFKMFIDAGMQPSSHELTEAEQLKLNKAYELLPALYKKVLQEHLHSISFIVLKMTSCCIRLISVPS